MMFFSLVFLIDGAVLGVIEIFYSMWSSFSNFGMSGSFIDETTSKSDPCLRPLFRCGDGDQSGNFKLPPWSLSQVTRNGDQGGNFEHIEELRCSIFRPSVLLCLALILIAVFCSSQHAFQWFTTVPLILIVFEWVPPLRLALFCRERNMRLLWRGSGSRCSTSRIFSGQWVTSYVKSESRISVLEESPLFSQLPFTSSSLEWGANRLCRSKPLGTNFPDSAIRTGLNSNRKDRIIWL